MYSAMVSVEDQSIIINNYVFGSTERPNMMYVNLSLDQMTWRKNIYIVRCVLLVIPTKRDQLCAAL